MMEETVKLRETGMPQSRREALIDATIEEVGRSGTLDVTVAQNARRAGVFSALAHHYFGGTEQIFCRTMRHILKLQIASVCSAQAEAQSPHARLEGIGRASLEPVNFRHDVVVAWMNFHVLAKVSDEIRRLLSVYQRRMRSNLLHEVRPLAGDRAPAIAETLATLIDGIYLRSALTAGDVAGEEASQRTLATLDFMLEPR